VLLDLKMPGLNGKQVLEVLKREHKFLEVIILTGHGSIDSAVECTRLGAFDYLPKPYELEKLLDKLLEAYRARLEKKFEADQDRLTKIADLATNQSALGILRELRRLDDDVK
jgi:DNA-binding NtrC family response regulator